MSPWNYAWFRRWRFHTMPSWRWKLASDWRHDHLWLFLMSPVKHTDCSTIRWCACFICFHWRHDHSWPFPTGPGLVPNPDPRQVTHYLVCSKFNSVSFVSCLSSHAESNHIIFLEVFVGKQTKANSCNEAFLHLQPRLKPLASGSLLWSLFCRPHPCGCWCGNQFSKCSHGSLWVSCPLGIRDSLLVPRRATSKWPSGCICKEHERRCWKIVQAYYLPQDYIVLVFSNLHSCACCYEDVQVI